ncbi:hypothetical protein EDC96DRAFT_513006 [Choanephora cucurbitarum]|nr:hypothetical protein EDC96DRAFT_513006 [Choanephora cucurbitarum]
MNTTLNNTSKYASQANVSLYDIWSDEMLAIWVPIAVYWIQSSLFEILMRLQIPFFEQYRMTTPNEKEKRNKVSFSKVLWMVAVQHIIQIAVGVALMKTQSSVKPSHSLFVQLLIQIQPSWIPTTISYQYVIPCIQFFCAMFIIDTHQYALHRLAHSNQFLYKHMHSHHHRLYAPYAFGALYNHPVEGFLLDSCGGALAFELTGMSPRLGMYFFIFSTLKTINDHCGYSFPWDPLTICFNNNVNYHHIHHQAYGIKTNFSQPFFTFWDVLLGTEYTQVMKTKSSKISQKSKQI